MSNTLFLLGQRVDYLDQLKVTLPSDYRVHQATFKTLIEEIYEKRPFALMVIVDDLVAKDLRLLDAALSLETIPTLAITFDGLTTYQNILEKFATLLDYHDNYHQLVGPLLSQARIISRKCRLNGVVMDIYELMQQELPSLLESLVMNSFDEFLMKIGRYLSLTLVENHFLDNKPKVIWMVLEEDNAFKAYRYDLQAITAIESYEIDASFYEAFISNGQGYLMTVGKDEYSDVEQIEDILPSELIRREGIIHTVVTSNNSDIQLITLNYSKDVTPKDLNILKGLSQNLSMVFNIFEQIQEIKKAFEYTMNALARAAEAKDDITGEHIKRVNLYSAFIAKELNLSEAFINGISIAAQMHDVGKLMIPDQILNKPGKLNEQEMQLMTQHPHFGGNVIGKAKALTMAYNISLYHHEKYDGSGYPLGIEGKNIPIEGRIVALADVYDALRSPRPYKEAFSHEKAYDIIVHGDGRVKPSHFDPEILKLFKKHHLVFKDIYDHYS